MGLILAEIHFIIGAIIEFFEKTFLGFAVLISPI
jgi:hypothetical protein